MRAFNFSTSREQPKEERRSRGHQRGSSSQGKHGATEGAAGNPQGRGHRAQAARRGRTSPNFRAAEKKGDSAPPTAARDDPAPQREQQPGQARSLRGSSRAAASTRGADNRNARSEGGKGRARKPKQEQSPGRATRPTEQGQRGKGTGPASPKAATSTGRRRPRDEAPPHVAFRTQQPKGEARRSKVKQGEARYFALSRAREGSFLILILGNISYLRKIPETFKKSSIYAGFGWILFKLFLYNSVVDCKKKR